MPIKKSDLYSKLWASCDELRGGMDASQYKDYVLVMLFIKYVSDKYAGQPFAPIQIPPGASFADMVALKGQPDIGDRINRDIIRPLEDANRLVIKADFNDDALLGGGKEKVEKLGNLIGIFESPDLDLSKNRAEGDDILGDAYEYPMRHFATESGKSKGQFYTPAEVSRVMAAVLGIAQARTTPDTTVYDPTCGSGSLLLKVADAAPTPVSVYGQEKDEVTSGLARMNMILHHNPGALIAHANTLADPRFKDGEQLKTFDYVVATLIDSLEQLLTKQRQIKQGARQELLTGQRRLPGFDGSWLDCSFGEIAEPRRDRSVPALMEDAPLCLELEHVQSSTGSLLADAFESRQPAMKTVFSKGDVLFGKLRAYLRKYWLAEFAGVCSTEIWALRPRGQLQSSAFLFCTVQRDDFIEVASSAYGTHMPRSDWSVVSAFRLRLPESAAEQHAIAQVLTDMDTALTALQARLTKARQLKQALMQVLLTGRIRLVAPIPPAHPD